VGGRRVRGSIEAPYTEKPGDAQGGRIPCPGAEAQHVGRERVGMGKGERGELLLLLKNSRDGKASYGGGVTVKSREKIPRKASLEQGIRATAMPQFWRRCNGFRELQADQKREKEGNLKGGAQSIPGRAIRRGEEPATRAIG